MRTAKNKLVLTIIILVACSIAYAASPQEPAAQVIQWKMQSIFSASDTAYTIQATGLVKRLNEGTNGRLHVTLYPPGTLCPEGQMFDAVSKGVLDAAVHSASASRGIVPEATMVVGLPASFENNSQFIEFFYKYGALDLLRQAYAKRDIFFLMPIASGEFALMTTFPIRGIDDIKGKKLYISGLFRELFSIFGASPVTVPPGELYMAMKMGTIDGATWTLPELETLQFKEVVKTVMLPYLLSPVACEVLVSTKSWKALPDDLKKTVENIAKEYAPITADELSEEGGKAIKTAKEYGVKFVTISDADQKRLRGTARKEAWDAFAKKSDLCKQLATQLEDYLKKKGIIM